MSRLDDLIAEALSAEEKEMLKDTAEPGWFRLGLDQFRGRYGWVTWVVMIVQATLFLAGVWCAVRFFAATEVLEALHWGLPAAVLVIVATVLKTSLMPQMQADRVLREIKRLELLIVRERG